MSCSLEPIVESDKAGKSEEKNGTLINATVTKLELANVWTAERVL